MCRPSTVAGARQSTKRPQEPEQKLVDKQDPHDGFSPSRVWKHLGLWSLALTAVAVVGSKLADAGIISSELFDNCPKWQWQLGILHQLFLFPPLMVRLYHETSGTREHMFWGVTIVSSMWGYMVKDFIFPLSMTFVVHHTLCMLFCLIFLFGFDLNHRQIAIRRCAPILVAMELGSCAFNTHNIYPGIPILTAAYVVVKTASHLSTLYFIYCLANEPQLATARRWQTMMFWLPLVGLCFVRQQFAISAAQDLDWSALIFGASNSSVHVDL